MKVVKILQYYSILFIHVLKRHPTGTAVAAQERAVGFYRVSAKECLAASPWGPPEGGGSARGAGARDWLSGTACCVRVNQAQID